MKGKTKKGVAFSMSETNRNCASYYTVKRGDSFYLIAQRLGISLRDLLDANPTIPPSRLLVGDVLCIPASSGQNPPNDDNNNGCVCPPCPETPSQPEQPEQPEQPYVCPPNRRTVVQEGQTASDLQLRYDLSYYTLQTANANTDLEAIKGGDVVCIPESNLPCNLPSTVTLKENETLESIAVTYNLPIASLLRVNPCLAPEDFAQGVTIRLPV